MKFDITKVRFEGYLCGLKAGCEGYFSDTMSGLQHCVEEDYRFNFGKIKKLMKIQNSLLLIRWMLNIDIFTLWKSQKKKSTDHIN